MSKLKDKNKKIFYGNIKIYNTKSEKYEDHKIMKIKIDKLEHDSNHKMNRSSNYENAFYYYYANNNVKRHAKYIGTCYLNRSNNLLGVKYQGEIYGSKFWGKGIYYDNENNVFEGTFKNSKIIEGTACYNNGKKFIGSFDNFKPHKGILYENDKIFYDGEFYQNNFHGHGTCYYKNGDKYKGNWINNKKNGYGTYTFKNGDIYEGNWINDKKNGYGTYNFRNGSKYEGNFYNDYFHTKFKKRCHKTKFIFSNAEIYIGNFKFGKFHGKGIYFYANNEKKYVGEFENGEFKNGKFYDEQKNFLNEFKNGKLRTKKKVVKNLHNIDKVKKINLDYNILIEDEVHKILKNIGKKRKANCINI